jgi:phenylpyruvate tautomerase PptA (4-oxalocrotonate tautomerase family)
MPTLIIKTNAPIPSNDVDDLILQASSLVAEALGKPEGYVMVALERPVAMCFGADTRPLALLELKSLGLPEDETPRLSSLLCAFLHDHLGVPRNRVYIEFSAPARHMFGFDGRTF